MGRCQVVIRWEMRQGKNGYDAGDKKKKRNRELKVNT
jgi:hypothetical protein